MISTLYTAFKTILRNLPGGLARPTGRLLYAGYLTVAVISASLLATSPTQARPVLSDQPRKRTVGDVPGYWGGNLALHQPRPLGKHLGRVWGALEPCLGVSGALETVSPRSIATTLAINITKAVAHGVLHH